jgi:carboxyl-terminal processing protease
MIIGLLFMQPSPYQKIMPSSIYFLRRSKPLCIVISLFLVACGGGSGNSTSPAAANASAQSQTKGFCAAPRLGIDPQTGLAFLDKQGSLEQEKAWVSAFSNDTYLWYSELPSLNAADFASPIDYFLNLKSQALTASGRAKDRFH